MRHGRCAGGIDADEAGDVVPTQSAPSAPIAIGRAPRIVAAGAVVHALHSGAAPCTSHRSIAVQ